MNDEHLYIVIVDNRGLTFVGTCDLSNTDRLITIKDARCVIRWGTTGHLAQLVNGPTENTKLGDKQDVIVNSANIVAAYKVKNVEAWG